MVVNAVVNSVYELSFAESVSAYPNPSSGQFELEIKGQNNHRPIELSVLDLNGKLLETSRVDYYGYLRHTFDLDHLSSGIYYLRIQSGQEAMSMKMYIVQ